MTWKAKPKGSNGWQKLDFCSIGISMGNPNCEGEKLQAIVNWLNAQTNFKGCMIDLSDSLNRYNIMLERGIDEESARVLAIAQGDEWLRKNKHIIDQIKIPFDVIRWDRWTMKPETKEYKAQFVKAFETDSTFRTAVFKDVNAYLDRNGGVWDLDNMGKMKYNVQYLLEELAVHSLIYDNGPIASIYPGRQQESFQMAREGKIANVPTSLTNSHFVFMNIYDDAPSNNNNGGNNGGSIQPGKGSVPATGARTRVAVRPNFTTSAVRPTPPKKPTTAASVVANDAPGYNHSGYALLIGGGGFQFRMG